MRVNVKRVTFNNCCGRILYNVIDTQMQDKSLLPERGGEASQGRVYLTWCLLGKVAVAPAVKAESGSCKDRGH